MDISTPLKPPTTAQRPPPVEPATSVSRLTRAIDLACGRIAPTWPLDRFIAVNPYRGWVGQPIAAAAARLGVLCGTRLTMPRAWFREQYCQGRFTREHLRAVAARHGGEADADALLEALHSDAPADEPLPLVTHVCDAAQPERTGERWSELVTHQISQHCAAFFDTDQARWQIDRAGGLYRSWRRQLGADRGLPWKRTRTATRARIAALANDPRQAIEQALAALGLPPDSHGDYLTALLLSSNGWAAWCAWQRWQARLDGRGDDDDDARIVELLAIRLAWESLLQDDDPALPLADWRAAWTQVAARTARLADAQRSDWLLQQAVELAYRQPLCAGLLVAPSETRTPPALQAVFCIDVRSEVLRRALERADPGVETRGCAGFFGLPIDYAPTGSALRRPQLPGLLAPTLTASEAAPAPGPHDGAPLQQALRQRSLAWRRRFADLRRSAASGFSFVETCGLGYGAELLRDSLPSQAAPDRWEDTGLPDAAKRARPTLPAAVLASDAAVDLAAGVLDAMGLDSAELAPLVLLAGHGSQSANNPLSAGLDCGACGGQTGEVNARVLADLLNAPALRAGLAARGRPIPGRTHFIAGLHNTTTDELLLFDTDAVAAPLRGTLQRLEAALAEAGRRARAERAAALGLGSVADRPDALAAALRQRANDWAQLRPEWGLAGNAAFIVAPRSRSRHLDLAGRCFLHDYDWRHDAGRGYPVLELIMTAPMVVANWINLQYHASTVDNRRWGSGNKLLHNVVGGHIGVFEGNGGELRIGLPLQSLHDGQRLRHTPLRLSVFIEAPRAAIDGVIEKHTLVRDLVEHGWLQLLRIDGAQGLVEQRRQQGDWIS